MEDIRSILSKYPDKSPDESHAALPESQKHIPTHSEIPDVFFDDVLVKFKLTRSEISLLMLLYRQVWCRPNLYRSHGIGPINSYADLAKSLHMSSDELIHGIRALESGGFITTIRAGQYFVRRFFTEALDQKFSQHYEF